ncbi:MAG: DUF2089 domain-containing protein, partial [Candidatus Marinimicrobia bacterium]|nr:DUF2089 domain-containing protein [Candidatus Neomarinimicrobiota bacterium]
SLACPNCKTTVNGSFNLPLLTQLSEDEHAFILKFVKYSGSLKKMAKDMQLNYPTVRNILNDIIERIEKLKEKNSEENGND